MKGMLSLLLISLVGWIDCAKMPKANWDNLQPNEKKAICQFVGDQYFKAHDWCGKIDMEVKTNGEDIIFSVKCIGTKV
jgi:hypothetical protein